MSYERFDRRRQNGYGIIITGYGGDGHYDHLGRGEEYEAETTRADNLRTMDEDLDAAYRTLDQRVPMDSMEDAIRDQAYELERMTRELREEQERNNIVDENMEMRWPEDPGRSYEEPLPIIPPPIDEDRMLAERFEREAMTRRMQSEVNDEYEDANRMDPGEPDANREFAQEQEWWARRAEEEDRMREEQARREAERAHQAAEEPFMPEPPPGYPASEEAVAICMQKGYEWYNHACRNERDQIIPIAVPVRREPLPPTREPTREPPVRLPARRQVDPDMSQYRPVPPSSQKIDYTKPVPVHQAYRQTYEQTKPLYVPPGYQTPQAPGLRPAATQQQQSSGGGVAVAAGAGLLALLMFLR